MSIDLLKINQHRRVYDAVRGYGEDGATSFEIIKMVNTKGVVMSASTVVAKIREQLRQGFLKEVGFTGDPSRKAKGSRDSVAVYVIGRRG